LDDGTAGLLAIKRCGGVALVQSPHEALYPQMPRSALDNVQVDYCLPVTKMGELLQRLALETVEQEASNPMPIDLQKEVKSVELLTNPSNTNELAGKASVYSCPECGGVLWEIQDGKLLRFRCRVGHAFSAQSVMAEQSEALDKALWIALKTLEEKIDLLRRLAHQARDRERAWLAHSFEEKAAAAGKQANLLHKLIIQSKIENNISETPDKENDTFGDVQKETERDSKIKYCLFPPSSLL
jgi:two-component system chemotaxis response regulator CheB